MAESTSPTLDDCQRCLQAVGERAGVLSMSIEAPRRPLHEVVALLGAPPCMLYESSRGPGYVALGRLESFRAPAEGRMEALHRWSSEVLRGAGQCAIGDTPSSAPVVVGGMAFAGQAPQEPSADWASFGPGTFWLPRMVYRQLGDRCTLSIHLRPDETASVALEVLQSALGPLRDAPAVPAVEPDPIPYEAVQQQPFEVWRDLIDRIHGAIASGDFDKLVAARRASVHADRPFDVVQILRRLAATYAGCTRFLVQVDDAAFVGATPERLFRLQGRQLVTHALAGSKFHGEPEGPPRDVAEAELLASTKDRWEHDVVVQRICTALGELDAHVTVPEEPSVISVRNLLHLNTPVEAVVPSSVHAPALIDALHPTPAVGGLPKWPAVDWIVAHEPGDRGWYTGTLGWIDADGAAEMAVAIRCGVVRGTTASLYAGAGVVADSTAEGEYEETRLKQHPMLHVLGVRLS